MKKSFFFSLAALTAVLLFTQIPSAEARHRNNTRVQLNVANVYPGCDACVVRRSPRPMVVAAPVYAPGPVYAYRPYCAPVYAYPAPVYVEEVYMAPRPSIFSGLSFSWNFGR